MIGGTLGSCCMQEGVIVIRTTMSMEDSTPARIARLTAAAQTRKPEIHSLLERVSQRYAQVVLGLTACCVVSDNSLRTRSRALASKVNFSMPTMC